MSVDIRSINNHLLADEKAREQISQLSKDVYDSIDESTNALLNDVAVKKLSTGCPIVIEDPVANVAFASVKQKFTPKQEGSGDPYPAGGGKNLLPGEGTYTFEKEYIISLQDEPLPPGTYTISAEITTTDTDTEYCRAYFDYANGTSVDCNISRNGRQSGTITATEPVIRTRLMASTYNAASTGDTATWKNVQLEAGTTATEYAPYSNIRPIVPWTELEMTRAGKNLLPNTAATTTTNGITYTINDDGTVVANGTATADVYLFVNRSLHLDANTYILNGCCEGGHGTTYNLYVYVPSENLWHRNFGNEDTVFTLKANCEIQVIIRIVPGISMNNAIFRPMIRHASVAEPSFEPYTSDTYTDTLETPMYGGERDWVNGELVDGWETITLDGSELVARVGSRQFGVTLEQSASQTEYTVKDALCSHLPYNPNSYGGVEAGIVSHNGYVFLRCPFLAEDTPNAFKTWIADQVTRGTPVQISYKLATPTTTQRTPQRITTIPGTNTVFGDGEFEIEWFKSTKKIAEERENLLLESFTDPLEAEGNLLVVKPVGGLPFDSVVTKFSPKQKGSGNPYPAGGGNQLCNITDYKSFTSSGITLTSSNGVVTLSGTATGTLTFGDGLLPVGTTGTFFISGSDGDVLVYARVTSSDGANKWYSNQSFTLDGSETRVVIYIQVNPGKTVNTTVYPMLNAGTSALPWEPYSNIRLIVPYTELSAVRAGKNLISEVSKDASKGFLWGNKNSPIALKAGRTYVLSTSNNAGTKAGGLYFVDSAGGGSTADEYILSYAYNVSEHRYTPEKDVDCMFLVCYASGVPDGTTIQLELGSTATPYEPYQGNTYTDTLETPMYGGERDWAKGELDDTHFLAEFTGNETWHASTSTPNAFYLTFGENTKLFPYGFKASDYNTVLRHRCSHYMAVLYSNHSLNNACVIYQGSRGNTFQIKDNRFSTVAEWVAYLAEQKLNETPVQVSFEREVLTTTQCTAHDIPALVGVNTLYGDGDSITVKGRQSKTIDLEERIAALEAAVLLS